MYPIPTHPLSLPRPDTHQKEAFDNLGKSQEDLQETTQKLGQAEKKLAELKDPTTTILLSADCIFFASPDMMADDNPS